MQNTYKPCSWYPNLFLEFHWDFSYNNREYRWLNSIEINQFRTKPKIYYTYFYNEDRDKNNKVQVSIEWVTISEEQVIIILEIKIIIRQYNDNSNTYHIFSHL